VSVKWFIIKDKKKVGPLSQIELDDLVKKNEIEKDTFIWKKGYKNWMKFGDVVSLDSSKDELENDINFLVRKKKKDKLYGPFTKQMLEVLHRADRLVNDDYLFEINNGKWVVYQDFVSGKRESDLVLLPLKKVKIVKNNGMEFFGILGMDEDKTCEVFNINFQGNLDEEVSLYIESDFLSVGVQEILKNKVLLKKY
jgi:hypothetical protein